MSDIDKIKLRYNNLEGRLKNLFDNCGDLWESYDEKHKELQEVYDFLKLVTSNLKDVSISMKKGENCDDLVDSILSQLTIIIEEREALDKTEQKTLVTLKQEQATLMKKFDEIKTRISDNVAESLDDIQKQQLHDQEQLVQTNKELKTELVRAKQRDRELKKRKTLQRQVRIQKDDIRRYETKAATEKRRKAQVKAVKLREIKAKLEAKQQRLRLKAQEKVEQLRKKKEKKERDEAAQQRLRLRTSQRKGMLMQQIEERREEKKRAQQRAQQKKRTLKRSSSTQWGGRKNLTKIFSRKLNRKNRK